MASKENAATKQKIEDLLNRNGIDLRLEDFGDLIVDVAQVLAEATEKTEPYATESIKLLRDGGNAIRNNLGYLED